MTPFDAYLFASVVPWKVRAEKKPTDVDEKHIFMFLSCS